MSASPAAGATAAPAPAHPSAGRPRLGFLGVGWIGRTRMEAVARSGAAEIVALVDAAPQARAAALASIPGAEAVESYEALLDLELDGIVIATPSALHAQQSIAALRRGTAVFCQKPLGRTGPETREVVEVARAADVLLGVDLSYRSTRAMLLLRDLVQSREIGHVYAAELIFHNAYGPDKPWFYDPRLSGGGCVMDLGIHLVDLALWSLGFPRVTDVSSRLYAAGELLGADPERVEDFATARLDLDGGSSVQIACSWNVHAGRDAVISATFFGSRGGVRMRNVSGSFYDFTVERFRGTSREVLLEPPDDWGGRAVVSWVERLAAGTGFDPDSERLVQVAEVLDRIYGR